MKAEQLKPHEDRLRELEKTAKQLEEDRERLRDVRWTRNEVLMQ